MDQPPWLTVLKTMLRHIALAAMERQFDHDRLLPAPPVAEFARVIVETGSVTEVIAFLQRTFTIVDLNGVDKMAAKSWIVAEGNLCGEAADLVIELYIHLRRHQSARGR